MTRSPLLWIGLGGVTADDNPRMHLWQQRLHWAMVVIALLGVPAYLLDSAHQSEMSHRLAGILDIFILAAFVAELVWMVSISSFPLRYIVENWLNLVIIAGATAAVLGADTGWVAIVRAMRAAIAVLVIIRTATEFHVLFTRRGAPMLLGAGFVIMLLAGGVFYWLDPAINSYWDGLWLAFITGTTVGYGDVVPTTGATRLFAAVMVLIGVSLIALFTANIVAFFIGREETRLREDLHHDIIELRKENARLLAAEEWRLSLELDAELRAVRAEVAALRSDLTKLHAVLPAPTAKPPEV
ncbi:MAG: ion channel [Betaproteobacteria bacterium]